MQILFSVVLLNIFPNHLKTIKAIVCIISDLQLDELSPNLECNLIGIGERLDQILRTFNLLEG